MCPLCQSYQVSSLELPYVWRCKVCDLTFKDAEIHLSAEKEKERYLLHKNDFEDQEYRNFLKRLAGPMLKKVSLEARGLDFGCGPTKVMAQLMLENKISCESYDPYFFGDEKVLNQRYDFITCSEVVEHFNKPLISFDLLFSLLKPNGWLGIMTQSPPDNLIDWVYLRDPTHVAFYSSNTFAWLAKHYSYERTSFPLGVTIFQKSI